MITDEGIVNFLLNITDAQSDYGKKVAKYSRLGRPDLKNEYIKLTLLSYYVRALEKQYDATDYSIDNFFTIEEAKDIVERINKICSTFIYFNFEQTDITSEDTIILTISSGSDVYRKRTNGSYYYLDYSNDGGVTWNLSLYQLVITEDNILITIDEEPEGYRQVIRDGNYCIDSELTVLGFDGVENTDWENIFMIVT